MGSGKGETCQLLRTRSIQSHQKPCSWGAKRPGLPDESLSFLCGRFIGLYNFGFCMFNPRISEQKHIGFRKGLQAIVLSLRGFKTGSSVLEFVFCVVVCF